MTDKAPVTPKFDLSPEARAALKLPLAAGDSTAGRCIRNADGQRVIIVRGTLDTTDDTDDELTAFIATALNELLASAPDQENFFDAVRADPDLSPERKAKWLALSPDNSTDAPPK
jgi:hypothetical protein